MKPIKGQMALPVVMDTHTKAEMNDYDRQRAYAEMMGDEVLRRQLERSRQARLCTCGKGVAPIKFHHAGCKVIPLKR